MKPDSLAECNSYGNEVDRALARSVYKQKTSQSWEIEVEGQQIPVFTFRLCRTNNKRTTNKIIPRGHIW